MRVQDPAKYAEVLLSIALPNAGYTAAAHPLDVRPGEQNIKFPTPIPVHITYQTAFVDDAGELQVRPDIYGIDTKTRNLIRSERGVVEPMPERGQAVASATPGQPCASEGAAAARPASSSSCSVAPAAAPPQRPPARRPLGVQIVGDGAPCPGGRFPQANHHAGPVNSRLAIRITAATFRHSPPVAI